MENNNFLSLSSSSLFLILGTQEEWTLISSSRRIGQLSHLNTNNVASLLHFQGRRNEIETKANTMKMMEEEDEMKWSKSNRPNLIHSLERIYLFVDVHRLVNFSIAVCIFLVVFHIVSLSIYSDTNFRSQFQWKFTLIYLRRQMKLHSHRIFVVHFSNGKSFWNLFCFSSFICPRVNNYVDKETTDDQTNEMNGWQSTKREKSKLKTVIDSALFVRTVFLRLFVV